MAKKTRTTTWIQTILEEASKLESSNGKNLMHQCGKECSKTSKFLIGAQKIRKQYKDEHDPDILFRAFKEQYYNNSNLTKDGNIITLIFTECTCPLVKDGVTNHFLCHCTAGFTKNIFETLFDRTIEVTIAHSILRGASFCKQVIKI